TVGSAGIAATGAEAAGGADGAVAAAGGGGVFLKAGSATMISGLTGASGLAGFAGSTAGGAISSGLRRASSHQRRATAMIATTAATIQFSCSHIISSTPAFAAAYAAPQAAS